MTKEIKTDGQDPMIGDAAGVIEIKGGDHPPKAAPTPEKKKNAGFDAQPPHGPGLHEVDPRA